MIFVNFRVLGNLSDASSKPKITPFLDLPKPFKNLPTALQVSRNLTEITRLRGRIWSVATQTSKTSVSLADAEITELCSTSLSPQKYPKVWLFLRPISRKSRLFLRPILRGSRASVSLLWGFCEPSVRPHFIPSTKQARRTGRQNM